MVALLLLYTARPSYPSFVEVLHRPRLSTIKSQAIAFDEDEIAAEGATRRTSDCLSFHGGFIRDAHPKTGFAGNRILQRLL
jgi:hypothetical protein